MNTVDDYIAAAPDEVRDILQRIRESIAAAVPEGQEVISYRMPTITLDGRNVVHFAAWAHHISVYPAPPAGGDLDADLAPHRASKGTLRFPLRDPIPYELIGRVAAALADRAT